jgi:hypothetical protein
MLDYLYANNYMSAFSAFQADAGTQYTPDPKAKYTGLLEKKWTSVIRLQKKARIFQAARTLCALDLLTILFSPLSLTDHGFGKSKCCAPRRVIDSTS